MVDGASRQAASGLPRAVRDIDVSTASPIFREMVNKVADTQDVICQGLAALDSQSFHADLWQRDAGGGGESRVIENGSVFEKGGVNVSVVHGPLSDAMARALDLSPDDVGQPTFYATGVSLVLHPLNPFVPTVHANYRYFELIEDGRVQHAWFGGGADLTPFYVNEDDIRHFHQCYRQVCDAYKAGYYGRYKDACDRYFYLPHRAEHRGVGGIFILKLNEEDAAETFAFISALADAFLPSYLPIVDRHKGDPYTDAQRDWQLMRRSRYAEFNLLYDVGTKFGFSSGGRTESILMSMPPMASWAYHHSPTPGSAEAELLDLLARPRTWA